MKRTVKDGYLLTIREAEVQDAYAIVSLVKEVAAEEVFILGVEDEYDVTLVKRYLERAKSSGRTFVLVAELDGRLIGVAQLKIGEFKKNSHTAEVGLVVLKEYRGLGVGSALMEEVLSLAGKKRVEKVWLSVFSTNKAAITLYKKFGFEVEGVRKKQIKVGEMYIDELMMAKFLS